MDTTAQPGELIRRLCLAYPWSAECQGIPPILPTATENAALWSGPGGYQQLVGSVMKKDIPLGTQCEPVQLVPLSAIGNRTPDLPLAQPSNSMFLQFPTPSVRGLENADFIWLFTDRLGLINSFI